MPNKLTPPPPTGIGILDRWLALLWRLLTGTGEIQWDQVSKAGSNLTEIETRNHNDLQTIQGGASNDYYHLTLVQHTDLTDGGLTDLHRHTADDVELERIGNSTYSHVQHLQNLFHSAGYISGGAVTDNGDGTVAIAAGTGAIRTSDSEVATVKFFDFAAVASQALTNATLNWVYIDYNAGAPIVTASTVEPANHHVYVKLATVYRDGTDLHINQTVRYNVGDHAANMVWQMQEVMPYAHISGASISETGTRNLAVTAGAFWHGLNRFTTTALDTAVSGSFSTYYRDGVGGFTHTTGQTQVNNTQYDDGSGTLASLSAFRYTNRWVYLATDSDVHVIYGQSQAVALADIQEEQPPSSLPAEIQNDSFLIGRIIIRQGTSTFIQIDSSFDVRFSASSISDHGLLSGLTDDDHPQYVLANGTRNITGPQLVTVDSASNALEIRQIGAGNALYIEDSANPDPSPFVINNAGNIIKGHTASVLVGGGTPSFQFHGTSTTLIAMVRWSNDATAPIIGSAKSRSATIAGTGALNSGDVTLNIVGYADDGTDLASSNAAILFVMDAAATTDNTPGALSLRTTPSGSNVTTERVRIDSSGQSVFGGTAATGNALSTTVSAKLRSASATYTDGTTASSGTVTHGTVNSFDNPAIAASNTTVTYTNASTVYIDGAPTNGTNVTISNPWSLFIAAGNCASAGNNSFGQSVAPITAVDTTSFATNIVTNTGATYTVLTSDHTIIQTTAASVYTLPSAASFAGRLLHLVTQFAGTVTSASSNVVPLAGGAAGTAILAATAGKYAKLQSDGTNWIIIEAN